MSEAIDQPEGSEKYKEVVLGSSSTVIPASWQVRKLGEVAEIVSGSTPKKGNPDYWGGDIVWITPTDVTKLGRKYIFESEEQITEVGLSNSSATLIEPGAVLMTSRATIGEAVINEVPVTTNQGFKTLVPNDEVDPEFLYYYIPSIKEYLNAIGGGSTFSEISKRDVSTIKLPLPPKPEQRRIADILSTVDEQIQRTEEVIEKTEELKRGLMQDIFNLDTTGDSLKSMAYPSLGEVPKELVGDHVSVISGVHVKSNKVSDDRTKTPYLTGPDDFDQFGFSVTKFTDDPPKFCEPGDILVTVKGSGCGKTTFANESAAISRQLKALRPNDSLDERYLYYSMETKQELLLILAQGTSIPGLSTSDLTTLQIPLPSIETQAQIGDLLSNIDGKIQQESQYKKELQELKRGLMQDLLTGKVRRTPDSDDGATTSDT